MGQAVHGQNRVDRALARAKPGGIVEALGPRLGPGPGGGVRGHVFLQVLCRDEVFPRGATTVIGRRPRGPRFEPIPTVGLFFFAAAPLPAAAMRGVPALRWLLEAGEVVIFDGLVVGGKTVAEAPPALAGHPRRGLGLARPGRARAGLAGRRARGPQPGRPPTRAHPPRLVRAG